VTSALVVCHTMTPVVVSKLIAPPVAPLGRSPDVTVLQVPPLSRLISNLYVTPLRVSSSDWISLVEFATEASSTKVHAPGLVMAGGTLLTVTTKSSCAKLPRPSKCFTRKRYWADVSPTGTLRSLGVQLITPVSLLNVMSEALPLLSMYSVQRTKGAGPVLSGSTYNS